MWDSTGDCASEVVAVESFGLTIARRVSICARNAAFSDSNCPSVNDDAKDSEGPGEWEGIDENEVDGGKGPDFSFANVCESECAFACAFACASASETSVGLVIGDAEASKLGSPAMLWAAESTLEGVKGVKGVKRSVAFEIALIGGFWMKSEWKECTLRRSLRACRLRRSQRHNANKMARIAITPQTIAAIVAVRCLDAKAEATTGVLGAEFSDVEIFDPEAAGTPADAEWDCPGARMVITVPFAPIMTLGIVALAATLGGVAPAASPEPVPVAPSPPDTTPPPLAAGLGEDDELSVQRRVLPESGEAAPEWKFKLNK
jgi:hypothetical protein